MEALIHSRPGERTKLHPANSPTDMRNRFRSIQFPSVRALSRAPSSEHGPLTNAPHCPPWLRCSPLPHPSILTRHAPSGPSRGCEHRVRCWRGRQLHLPVFCRDWRCREGGGRAVRRPRRPRGCYWSVAPLLSPPFVPHFAISSTPAPSSISHQLSRSPDSLTFWSHVPRQSLRLRGTIAHHPTTPCFLLARAYTRIASHVCTWARQRILYA